MSKDSTRPRKFRFVLIGEEPLLARCGAQLLERKFEIVALVTNRESLKSWGQEQQVRTFPFSGQLHTDLSEFEFDYLLSIANLNILPDRLLELPKEGSINFHDGLLPDYGGVYTTSWAIYNREKEHGITWHYIDSGIDTGEILHVERFALAEDETAFTLNVRCHEAAIETFGPMIDGILDRSLQSSPQTVPPTYYTKKERPPAAGTIDWTQPAEAIDALCRALDFGSYANPLSMPKLFLGSDLVLVPKVIMTEKRSDSGAMPGQLLALNREGVTVATGSVDLIIPELKTANGDSLLPQALVNRYQFKVGDRLPLLPLAKSIQLDQWTTAAAKQEIAVRHQLASLIDVELPYAQSAVGFERDPYQLEQTVPDLFESNEQLWATVAIFLLRLSGQAQIDLSVGSPQVRGDKTGLATLYFAERSPLRITRAATAAVTYQQTRSALKRFQRRGGTFAQDLLLRDPALIDMGAHGQMPLTVGFDLEPNHAAADLPSGLTLHLSLIDSDAVDERGETRLCWRYDGNVYSAADIERMQGQLVTLAQQIRSEAVGEKPLAALSLLSEAERQQMLVGWNETEADYQKEGCIHSLFMDCVATRPEQIAVEFKGQSLTYRALDERSNRLAHYLIELGVGPDMPVGVYMGRSLDLMVALFGILKAGGAYLPLDPDYPAERLAFMVEDTASGVILTEQSLLSTVPSNQADIVVVDRDWETIATRPETAPDRSKTGVKPHHLAYLIYTSGSTGKPKGVMVEHRNAVNFFVGMDERIPHAAGDVWLAVTSLSFDISVLELFWTLSRGLTVILYDNEAKIKASRPLNGTIASSTLKDKERRNVSTPLPPQKIDFGLFYFASDADEADIEQDDKYELLLEGAKFADQHHFSSVWTPERHFHAFGGLYPNPAVTGAAVAAITQNVRIMAGSCVLPLHHPIRVVEDWSVVDNLSRGRVGLSFASGWQPNDFVLFPDNFAENKKILFDNMEVVKQLWRGETLTFPGPKGDVPVSTLPRPVQAELPIWVTAAGNPDTFRMAGEGGYHMLTHLLGQTVEEVGEKLAIYREGWRKSGRPGNGYVSLMLHTFIGEDGDMVREMVRGPLIEYLRSSVFLIKRASWSFPTFQQKASATGKSPLEIFEEEDLSPEEMDALLSHAFERYYDESGLLGTPEKCVDMVARLKGIGVDEIACQIDFGVPSPIVMTHLQHLRTLRDRVNPVSNGGLLPDSASATADSTPPVVSQRLPDTADHSDSIAELIVSRGVTHFQCTPSMMRMLLVEDEMKGALAHLQVCMLGGEALPQALAAEVISGLTHNGKSGKLINMYGPTETTIWSSTEDVTTAGTNEAITIGRPIANTQLYIVEEIDGKLEPVPVGVPGELLIGGDGVVRGYHNRPDLTAERFVTNHFRPELAEQFNGRMYRTGDLARYRADGKVDFLGRLDFQVKIRGYRIELGEIEALLNAHPQVREAVINAWDEPSGNKALVAYVMAAAGFQDIDALRGYLKRDLPDFMVPTHFMFMDAFPLTPNKKTDRKALPSPELIERPATKSDFEPPQTDLEREIARLWGSILNANQIGREDNFFDLGGDSLSAVRMRRMLRDELQVDLPVQDFFELGTIAALGARIEGVGYQLPIHGDPLPVTNKERRDKSDRLSVTGVPSPTTANDPQPSSTPDQLLAQIGQLAAQQQQMQQMMVEMMGKMAEMSDNRTDSMYALTTPANGNGHHLETAKSGTLAALSNRTSGPNEDRFPLTADQQGVWMDTRFSANANSAYNVPWLIELDGPLNLNLFEKAINETFSAHDSFHLRFDAEGAYQTLLPAADRTFQVGWVNLATENEKAERLKRLHQDASTEPFDIENGPLARATLIKLGEDRHQLHFVGHHLVTDGWGNGVVLQEIRARYSAYLAGKPYVAPPTESYRDFAAAHSAKGRSIEGQQNLDYWVQTLSPVPEPLQLPTDFARPAIKTFKGAGHFYRFDPTVIAAARQLAKSEHTTLYNVLLAAFKAYLYRLSNQDDLIVAVPVAGQALYGMTNLTGFAVHTIMLRTHVDGEASFVDFMQTVQANLLEGQAHQPVAIGDIIHRLELPMDMSRTPLTDVGLSFNRPLDLSPIGDLQFEMSIPYRAASPWDFYLMLTDRGDTLTVDTEYNADIFTEQTLGRMLHGFEVLLNQLVAQPQQTIKSAPLLSAEDRQQMLVEWNRTEAEYRRDACMHTLFAETAAQRPEQTAVTFADESLTYAELDKRANRLAHHLLELGVGPDKPVGIYMHRSLHMLVALYGVLKAGGAYLPLDPDYPADRIAFMVEDTACSVILTDEVLLNDLPPHNASIVALDRDREAISRRPLEAPETAVAPHHLAYLIYTSGSTGKPKGVMVEHRNAINFFVGMDERIPHAVGDIWLAVTSLSFDISVLELFWSLSRGLTVILYENETKRAIAASASGKALPVSAQSGLSIPELIERYKITHFQCTPSMMRMLLLDDAMPQALARLQVCMLGGEAMPQGLAAEVLDGLSNGDTNGGDGILLNMYGPTETTIWSSTEQVTATDKPISVGRPIANTQLYILDEQLAPVPVGMPGELMIGGDGVVRGYYNRPELTAERFIENPFKPERHGQFNGRIYRTGDLARYREDGRVEFIGRADFQVKIRGHRIELGEIEALLNTHPQVREAVIAAPTDSGGEKRLVAYLLTHDGYDDIDALRRYIRETLPAFMVPSNFMLMDAFPLTPNKKTDRKALPIPNFEEISVSPVRETAEQSDLPARRTDTEQELLVIWRGLLGIEEIGLHDDFFEIGGHSLLALRLTARIKQTFDLNIPIATLLGASTIQLLAAHIDRYRYGQGSAPAGRSAVQPGQPATAAIAQPAHRSPQRLAPSLPAVTPIVNDGWSPLVPIQREGDKPPLYCIHGAGGNVLIYRELAQHLKKGGIPFFGLQSPGQDGNRPFVTTIEEMAAIYAEKIIEHNPDGPYYLSGYCMGGTVALEIAQNFKRQGREVGFLGLFETYDWRFRLPPTVKNMARWQAERLLFHWRNLQQLDQKGKNAFLSKKWHILQERVLLNTNGRIRLGRNQDPVDGAVQDDETQARIKALWESNDIAAEAYHPHPYDGVIVHFRPKQDYTLHLHPNCLWDDIARQGVITHTLPSYPAGMLVEPYVAQLAKLIQKETDMNTASHPILDGALG